MSQEQKLRSFGQTSLQVSRLGLAAGYGVGAAGVRKAFEHGVNTFYWGSFRRSDFGAGLTELARDQREKMVVIVQSYSRAGWHLRWSVQSALRKLKFGYTDILLLGWYNSLPPGGVLDAAEKLRSEGKIKHIMLSCHNRPSFAKYVEHPSIDAIMVRYNAVHPGAETDVFPHLEKRRVGVASYTATCWGMLLDPKLVGGSEPAPRASDCYRYVISNPNVDVAMLGPKNEAELTEGLAALERGEMSADELEWMRRVGKNVRSRVTGPRKIMFGK